MRGWTLAIVLLLSPGSLFAKTFYFPHYGDGSGLSMLFSVSNFAASPASGTMSFFDMEGNPQDLPFASGAASQMALILQPNATAVFKTEGSSNPVKQGYVKVELDQDQVSGVAIFQFSSGLETSVLPLELGRRFTVFVERSGALDTGVAVYRASAGSGVTARLYDLQGAMMHEGPWNFSGNQTAAFLGQIFSSLGNTQGVLELESEDPFAPVGLRFGGGVLSTVPVVGLPERVKPYVLHGLDFGPYVGGSAPPTNVTETRLRQLIDVIAPHVKWLRTYTSTSGIGKTATIAQEKGIDVAMGAWLDNVLQSNETEINALIALGQAGLVDIAVVGSETLERGQLTEQQLIDYIKRVKQALPGIFVTTADTFHQLLNHPNVVNEVDVVFANYYPLFDGVPLDAAIRVLHGWHQQLQGVAGQKEIIVSETGWPSCGNHPSGASEQNAAFYFLNFVSWARANNVKYFYFEAFDERWKGPVGNIERCFGVWSETFQLKPGMKDVLDGRTIPDNWTSQ